MSDKRGDGATKALGAAAAFVAAFATRKVVNFGWTRLTGKEPPTDPQDPQVGTAEALGFAIVLGMVMGAARVLAVRAATGQIRRTASERVE